MKTTDANQWLRNDHKTIVGLIRQYQALDRRLPTDRELIDGVAREILMQIEIHSKLEKEIFYPAFKAAATDDEDVALINQSYSEHESVDEIVLKLKAGDPSSAEFLAELSQVVEDFEAHSAKEENELLPRAQTLLATSIVELGDELQRGKEKQLSDPQYATSLPQRVQNPNGGEQKRKLSVA